MSTSNLVAILVVYLVYWVIFGRHPQGIWLCFWRAVGLALVTFVGTIVGLFEVYRFLILYLLCLVYNISEPNILLLTSLVFLVFSLAIYLVLVAAHYITLKIFWSNPPKWLRFRNFKSICLGFLIAVVASFPASITYAPFLAEIPNRELIAEVLMNKGYEIYDIVSGMFLIWFLFAVGCYHAEYKFSKFRAYRKKRKQANSSSS